MVSSAVSRRSIASLSAASAVARASRTQHAARTSEQNSCRCFSSSTLSSASSLPRPSAFDRSSRRPSQSSSSEYPRTASGPKHDRAITPQASTEALQQELSQRILPGFPVPNEMAVQMVTHESWDYGKGLSGHNRRLSFLGEQVKRSSHISSIPRLLADPLVSSPLKGRRALKAFLVMFFHDLLLHVESAEAQSSLRNALFGVESTLLADMLHTSLLGKNAGQSLQLERVMRWTPAILPSSSPSSTSSSSSDSSSSSSSAVMAALESRETGLWRVRGVCLEAVVGALYHQHGAQLAQLFFRSQVLPTLTGRAGVWPDELPHSVQESMRAAAEQATLQLNSLIAGTAPRGAQAGAPAQGAQVYAQSVPQASAQAATA